MADTTENPQQQPSGSGHDGIVQRAIAAARAAVSDPALDGTTSNQSEIVALAVGAFAATGVVLMLLSSLLTSSPSDDHAVQAWAAEPVADQTAVRSVDDEEPARRDARPARGGGATSAGGGGGGSGRMVAVPIPCQVDGSFSSAVRQAASGRSLLSWRHRAAPVCNGPM